MTKKTQKTAHSFLVFKALLKNWTGLSGVQYSDLYLLIGSPVPTSASAMGDSQSGLRMPVVFWHSLWPSSRSFSVQLCCLSRCAIWKQFFFCFFMFALPPRYQADMLPTELSWLGCLKTVYIYSRHPDTGHSKSGYMKVGQFQSSFWAMSQKPDH